MYLLGKNMRLWTEVFKNRFVKLQMPFSINISTDKLTYKFKYEMSFERDNSPSENVHILTNISSFSNE